MLKYYEPKADGKSVYEVMADAYRDWKLKREQGKGTFFGKLMQKIKDFIHAVKRMFAKTDEVENIMRDIESGEVWNRDSDGNPILGAALLREDVVKWKETIKDFLSGVPLRGPVYIMQTPIALELAGAKHLPIRIDLSIVSKILLVKHRNDGSMNQDVLEKIPAALVDPMLIYKSDDVNGKQVLVSVLELEDANGDNVIVPLILNEFDNRYVINKIQTAYGKEALKKPNSKWLADRLKGGKLQYLNREKTTAWSQSFGLQLPLEVTNNSGLSVSSIPTEQDLVKRRLNYPERYSASSTDINYSVLSSDNSQWKLQKSYGELVGAMQKALPTAKAYRVDDINDEMVRFLHIKKTDVCFKLPNGNYIFFSPEEKSALLTGSDAENAKKCGTLTEKFGRKVISSF